MKEKLETMLKTFISFIKLLFEKKADTDTIILVSHSALESGGAPVVLFELALELKKKYNVIFLSKRPGELLKKCRDNGICSYVFGYIPQLFFLYLEKKGNIKCYLVNTIVCGNCVEALQKKKNRIVYWWLHENKEIYDIMEGKLPKKIDGSIRVRCVSESVQDTFKRYYPGNNTELMYYGLPDLLSETRFNRDNKGWTLLSVGQIVERKNTQMILEAWREFQKQVSEECELVIVGSGSENDAYYRSFKELLKEIRHVTYHSFVPRNEMKEIYMRSNAFICVSTSDPLPVVVSEAFMYKIPTIIGSGVGQYKMVEDKINAFKCTSEDKDSIVNAMLCAYKERNNLFIGGEGRKIYEANFSVESIAKKILFE